MFFITLSQYSDEDIKGAVRLKVAFMLLKHIFLEDLPDRLPDIFRLLKKLAEKRSGLEYLETILKYVVSGSDHIRENEIEDALNEVFMGKGGNVMPTLAEQWIQKGMQQGILQNARESVIDNLEVRFEVVPESVVSRLNGVYDSSVLKILRRKAIKVNSVEEFERIIDMMIK